MEFSKTASFDFCFRLLWQSGSFGWTYNMFLLYFWKECCEISIVIALNLQIYFSRMATFMVFFLLVDKHERPFHLVVSSWLSSFIRIIILFHSFTRCEIKNCQNNVFLLGYVTLWAIILLCYLIAQLKYGKNYLN